MARSPIPTDIRRGLAEAAEAVNAAQTIVTTGHVGPDGDALGSSVALAFAATKHGKSAVASYGGEQAGIKAFDFLPIEVVVPPAEAPPRPDLLVSFDVGDLDRIGEVAEIAALAGSVVMIDHHVSTKGFGDININMPTAAAAAQLCFYLLEELGWQLDEPTATCLLTGLVTDTGRFQYSNTSPEVLRVAAELVEAGARPELIGQRVYESVPFAYLGLSGEVLMRSVLDVERRFVSAILTQADLDKYGLEISDIDPLIDAVRVAAEADVAALIKQSPGSEESNCEWKVSLRSRGRVDVAAIAQRFGGGGHHNAAGFTFEGTADQARESVIGLLP